MQGAVNDESLAVTPVRESLLRSTATIKCSAALSVCSPESDGMVFERMVEEND